MALVGPSIVAKTFWDFQRRNVETAGKIYIETGSNSNNKKTRNFIISYNKKQIINGA